MRKPFYGWVIVGVSFLIGITEAGAFQNILSIFMKPMTHDFGWSRASVTGSIAFGSICAGLLAPLIGPILDRHGPRMVAFWGSLIVGLGLVGMAFGSRIWHLYLFFGVGRMVAVGALGLAATVSISNWFVRLRGRAMGIAWLGPKFGGVLLPALSQWLIMAQGWRMAWGTLGAVVFLISGLPALLFYRRRPEDMGLQPDGTTALSEKKPAAGDPSGIESADIRADDPEPVWSRSLAIRTQAFWMLACAHSLVTFSQASINFHIFPFLTDQGFSEVSAVLVLSIINIAGAVGSVSGGLFAEKYRIQSVLCVNILVSGLVFLCLYQTVLSGAAAASVVGMVFFLAVLQGVLHGARMPLLNVAWAEFFGRQSLGLVMGISSVLLFAANAVGPVFAALVYDFSGSYAFPFAFFVVLFTVAGVMSYYMKPPRAPLTTEAA